MAITHLIKGLLPSRHKRLLDDIRALPEGERLDKLGAIFYDECVRQASDFVQSELLKKESPFRGRHHTAFFHELMAINFWSVARVFNGKTAGLMERLHRTYCRSYRITEGVGSGEAAAPPALTEKYRTYNESWNDVTGFQDLFGLRAAEHVFGKGTEFPSQEASFWMVFYAHEVKKEFSELKALCRARGIAVI
ncbi:MAG: hypothetical protein AB1805_16395 [Nitrospirota bacterium]